jgi:hypothetical protein
MFYFISYPSSRFVCIFDFLCSIKVPLQSSVVCESESGALRDGSEWFCLVLAVFSESEENVNRQKYPKSALLTDRDNH